MRGVADTNLALVAAIGALSLVGLTTKRQSHRTLIFVPLAGLSVYLVLFTASDDLPRDYFVGCSTMINLFRMSDLLCLTDVQRDLQKRGEQRDVSKESFLSRLKWALSLYASVRGVGWNHEPTSHLPPPPFKMTRRKFLLHQARQMAQTYLILNLGNFFGFLNSSFDKGGPPFLSQPWWILPTTLSQSLVLYGALNGVYLVFSIVGVFFHLSAPKDWPPFFGTFSEAYTLRNYWGRVWHQALRKFVTGYGNALANTFRVPKGRLRTYFRLYVAFTISGLIHYFGDYMILRNWGGGSLVYFISQACAVTFEDATQWLVRRSGLRVPTGLSRLIGYAWVLGWFSYTIPIWMGPLVEGGITSDSVSASPLVWNLSKNISSHLRPQNA